MTVLNTVLDKWLARLIWTSFQPYLVHYIKSPLRRFLFTGKDPQTRMLSKDTASTAAEV